MPKNRLEAFSDGVFAVAITLLILDVHLPSGEVTTLEALHSIVPHLVAFVLSFVIVGVYWVAHHNMLHYVHAVDRTLLWLNLALLLVVVFIPFPAALLGHDIADPLAVSVYGVNLMFANAVGTILWLYAGSRPHLMGPGTPRAAVRFVARLHAAPILVYAAGVALAWWHVGISLVLYLAVPAFFILPNAFIDRRLAAVARGTEE